MYVNNNSNKFERIIIIEVGLLGYANFSLLLPVRCTSLCTVEKGWEGGITIWTSERTLRQVHTTEFAQLLLGATTNAGDVISSCRAVPLPFHLTVDFVVVVATSSKDNELSPPRHRSLTLLHTYANILQNSCLARQTEREYLQIPENKNSSWFW